MSSYISAKQQREALLEPEAGRAPQRRNSAVCITPRRQAEADTTPDAVSLDDAKSSKRQDKMFPEVPYLHSIMSNINEIC